MLFHSQKVPLPFSTESPIFSYGLFHLLPSAKAFLLFSCVWLLWLCCLFQRAAIKPEQQAWECAEARAAPFPSEQNFNLLLFSYDILPRTSHQSVSAILPGQGCTKQKLHSFTMEGLNYNLGQQMTHCVPLKFHVMAHLLVQNNSDKFFSPI